MEWLNVIIGALSTLIGLVGGGVGIYYWKESKEMYQIRKTSENRIKI